MPIVKTSSKGQIVIPAAIGKKLGIKPGQAVRLTRVDDRAMIEPLPDDPIRALRGCLKGKPSMTEALLEERAGERARERSIAAGLVRLAGLDPG